MPGQAFLVRDNWDDYSFKTTFQLLCVDPGGEIREIGGVKIGQFGMTAPASTPLPDRFDSLDGGLLLTRTEGHLLRTVAGAGP